MCVQVCVSVHVCVCEWGCRCGCACTATCVCVLCFEVKLLFLLCIENIYRSTQLFAQSCTIVYYSVHVCIDVYTKTLTKKSNWPVHKCALHNYDGLTLKRIHSHYQLHPLMYVVVGQKVCPANFYWSNFDDTKNIKFCPKLNFPYLGT